MRFKKFKPNDYVMVIKNGKVIKEGLGLSLLYNDMTTNIMVAPAIAFDGAFAFDDLMTSDYQNVCVQGVTTYKITDYSKAAEMLDFAYTPTANMEEKNIEAMKLLEKRINNIIKAVVIREVSKQNIRTIIRLADDMANLLSNALQKDEAISKLGVSIMAVNILGINPKVETRKALEAAAREEILKEQDDAIYKRRNAAIEQERIIKENEINTEIKVAEKEKEKKEKEQEMKRYVQQCELDMRREQEEKEMALKEFQTTKRMKLEKETMVAKMELENKQMLEKIELEKKNKEYTALEVENEKIKADQQAYAVAALVQAYNSINVALVEACAMANMDPGALMAKAFMNIGDNADKIGNLNFTPDLLQSIVNGVKTGEN